MVWLVCFVLCCCAISYGSDERPICLAVVAEGEAAGFGDALVATLGTDSNVQFVERSKLDELATEAALGNLSAEKRPVALARLAKADGLVFAAVNKGDAQTKASLMLRMVATGDGRVVGGLVLPWIPNDVETNARLAAARAKSWLPQVHSGHAGSRVAIALLGIRAVRDGSDTRPFEVTLNTLLAHRLAGESGVSLLERWRTDELVFEQSLEEKNTAPLSAAVRLIDGSFDIKSTGAVEVHLRQRSSDHDEGSMDSVSGKASEVQSLVDKIVDTLRMGDAFVSSTWPGNPAQEAQAFANLGKWLLDHEMGREAAAAFESALALGDASRDTLKGRARAWGLVAYPYRTEKHFFWGGDNNYSTRNKLKSEALPGHLTAAVRALDSALASQDFTAICLGLRSALWVSCAVYEQRAHMKVSAQVEHLRTAMRDFIADADQREDEAPEYLRLFYALLKADFAAYWCTTPEETLAYYDKVLSAEYAKSVRMRYPSGWEIPLRESLISRPCLHGPLLNSGTSRSGEFEYEVCQERLIDWTVEDNRGASSLWREYLAKLRASSSLADQAVGLSFALRSSGELSSRLGLLKEMLEFLSKNRSALCQGEGRIPLTGLAFDLQSLYGKRPGSEEIFRGFVKLQQELFGLGDWIPVEWVKLLDQLGSKAARETLTGPEVLPLIRAFGIYAERAKNDPRSDESSAGHGVGRGVQAYRENLFSQRNALMAAWPHPEKDATGERVAVKLVVNRFIETRPGRIGELPKPTRCLHGGILEAHGEEVWAMDDGIGVVAFHPADGRVTQFGRPPPRPTLLFEFECYVPTEEGIWAAGPAGLWYYQRNSRNWVQPEFPRGYSFVRECGLDVYAAYGCTNIGVAGDPGAGVARMTSLGPEWVFSTRRRPAQHPLDNAVVDNLIGLLRGPLGEPMVIFRENNKPAAAWALKSEGIPCFRESPICNANEVIPCGEQTLLWYGYPDLTGKVWLMDPKLLKPDLLLAWSHVSSGRAVNPRWKTGDIFRVTEGTKNWLCPFVREDELWVLQWQTTPESGRGAGNLQLIGFLPGRESGLRIPLRLELPEEFTPLRSGGEPMASRLFELLHPLIARRGMVATSYGVVFCGARSSGIWVIPWREIRAWMATHPDT